jgi:hypothetical protein
VAKRDTLVKFSTDVDGIVGIDDLAKRKDETGL